MTVLHAECPQCGQPPALAFETQAFCGNDSCFVLIWNPQERFDPAAAKELDLSVLLGEPKVIDDPMAALDSVPHMPGMYFDPDGNDITMRQWSEIYADRDRRVVRQQRIGSVFLSTVWLGLNHGWGDPAPLIFETMTFPARLRHRKPVRLDSPRPMNRRMREWQICRRYSTRQEALAGHARWEQRIKAGGVQAVLREYRQWG